MAFAPIPRQQRRVRKISRGVLAARHYAKRAHLFGDVEDGTLGRSWLAKRWGKGPSVKGLKSSIKGTGHTVGKIASSKITKGILATGLAATGVGAGASAAIMATTGAAGGALKKGGGLRQAARGAAVGAATGAAAGVAGKFLPKVPGLRTPVSAVRRVAGKVPVLRSLVPKQRVVSHDAASKIDALATQPLPDVSITPSEIPSLPSATPVFVARDAAQDAAKEYLRDAVKSGRDAMDLTAKAGTEKNPSRRRGLMERAAKAAKQARDAAAQANRVAQVVDVSTPPSANGVAPQGGFPVSPEPAFPVPQTEEQQRADKSTIPPVFLIAAVGLAAFAMLRK